jgi:hypothetical protein
MSSCKIAIANDDEVEWRNLEKFAAQLPGPEFGFDPKAIAGAEKCGFELG